MATSKVPHDKTMTTEVRSFLDDLAIGLDNAAAGSALATTTITAAGLATGGGDLSADRTITVTAATQSDQATATSTTVAVVPGVQQYHPSAAKCWGYVTMSGGTPTLQANFNITSVTDTGVGQLTFTIATDFSTADWCCMHGSSNTNSGDSTSAHSSEDSDIRTAGACLIYNWDITGNNEDPVSYSMAGYGTQ